MGHIHRGEVLLRLETILVNRGKSIAATAGMRGIRPTRCQIDPFPSEPDLDRRIWASRERTGTAFGSEIDARSSAGFAVDNFATIALPAIASPRFSEIVSTQPTMMAPELASETLQNALMEFKRVLEADPQESKEFLRMLVDGEVRLKPKEVSPDKTKGETRSTWYYEISGLANLQAILVPVRGGNQDGLPEVAGARTAGWIRSSA